MTHETIHSVPSPPRSGQSGHNWSASTVSRCEGNNAYNIQLRAPDHIDEVMNFFVDRMEQRQDALQVGANLLTLLEAWPFRNVTKGLIRKSLVRLATGILLNSAPVLLSGVALDQRKCSSSIRYFIGGNGLPTEVTSASFKVIVSLDDIIQGVDVPEVPSHVSFRAVSMRSDGAAQDESAEAQAARRVVQYICWKLYGSIATPQDIKLEVKTLLESFLIQRFPIVFFRDRGSRPSIGFSIRYFDTKRGSSRIFQHNLTTKNICRSANIDDLRHRIYGSSGDPQLPTDLDDTDRLICEESIKVAKRFCWDWRKFEGTAEELREQIQKEQNLYMKRIGPHWMFGGKR